MIFTLLSQVYCEVIVFTGFPNETLILWPQKVNLSNSNIQNFVDNEYVAMNYYVKENLLQSKVREYYENQFSFYDIWLLHSKRDNYKIFKITPFLNYKTELIYEFTNKRTLCLRIYLFQNKFILDCQNYIDFEINLIEVDLITNNSQTFNITFNHDLGKQRQLYFSNDLIIFLIQELDNDIISVYNQTMQEMYQLNKTNFQLPMLNIKKIIMSNSHIIALTKCQRLYKIYLFQEQPQQLCYNLQIYDIEEIQGVEIMILTKHRLYTLWNYNDCYEKHSNQQQITMYQVYQDEEIGFNSYKYTNQYFSTYPLKICNPLGLGEFYYYRQMFLCKQMHNLYHVVLPTIKFQQILISNNFYKNDDQLIIIRSMEPGEIKYIETDEEFFPILNIQSENFEIMHHKLFYGPNITYTFKAQDVKVEFSQIILQNTYDFEQCVYHKIIQFYERVNIFSLICQTSNNSVIITQLQPKQTVQNPKFSADFSYIYDLDVQLSECNQIINADYLQFELLNFNTKETRIFKQQNQFHKNQHYYYKNNEKFNCYMQPDFLYCNKGIHYQKSIFQFSNLKRLGIEENIKFIYLPSSTYILFIVTQNHVIIIHMIMVDDIVQQFQLVLTIEVKNEVKQLYYSSRILYIIQSIDGYLQIDKYFKVSEQYFKHIGQVDCLGYKIGEVEENNNWAQDYYFINSVENVIIFQLSKSLQDSFLQMIPNAKFLISMYHQFCIKQDKIAKCYTIIENYSSFKVNLDQIKFSQSIPYEICAKNQISTKCVKQNLKLLVSRTRLKIDGYYLKQISQDVYQLYIQIQQGHITDLSIIDGNAILLNNLQLIEESNNIIQSFQELQDQIILNFYGQPVTIYDKKFQNYSTINVTCKALFFMKTHILCQESQMLIYACDNWNCTYKNRAQVEGVTVTMKSSGYFLLQKSNTKLSILQYRPRTYDFNHVFIDYNQTQFELIQSINDNDFWLIRVKGKYLLIYKFTNLQLQISKTINYTDRFNLDNQYIDKNDIIQNILTLSFDQNSISVLFLMISSSHKAYKINLINDQLDISCLFVLLWSSSEFHHTTQRLIFFLNNNLLFVLMKYNYVGVYNVSQDQKFYRNIIFYFKLTFSRQESAIKRMYHFSHNNSNFIIIQTIQQFYIYQVDLSYKLKILSNKNFMINLNRMNENILIKIEIPLQQDSYNYQYFVILILIIIYIYGRFRLIQLTR